MGGRGFAPGDPEQRRRRNADTVPTVELTADQKLRGLELPEDVLEESWHPQTLRWWNTWRSSPQAQTFLQTDWDFLLDTALMHHGMWSRGRFDYAAELRLRVAKLGATPEDRSRLRMKITDSTTPEGKPTRSLYGHLRPVQDDGA
jgi:hypothetical protein